MPADELNGCTGDKGKRLAALEILITLFRVYFAINNLRLCKNLISAVDSRQFPPFQAFPASQRVTYNFFLGRIQIYDENYVSPMRLPSQPPWPVLARAMTS